MIILENPNKLDRELKKMTGTTVKDICTSEPVTVTEETPMDELASIMSERHLHTLPVLKDGRLVGVIGKADIIRAMFP
jgi:CBS domain-containing protein